MDGSPTMIITPAAYAPRFTLTSPSVLKDADDRDVEIPFPKKPLQALVNVLRRRERTPYDIEAFVHRT